MMPNSKPVSLDDLFDHAAYYAEFKLRHHGSLPGTLFLLGPQGPSAFVPPTLADEDAKNAFAADARLLCVAQAVALAAIRHRASPSSEGCAVRMAWMTSSCVAMPPLARRTS